MWMDASLIVSYYVTTIWVIMVAYRYCMCLVHVPVYMLLLTCKQSLLRSHWSAWVLCKYVPLVDSMHQCAVFVKIKCVTKMILNYYIFIDNFCRSIWMVGTILCVMLLWKWYICFSKSDVINIIHVWNVIHMIHVWHVIHLLLCHISAIIVYMMNLSYYLHMYDSGLYNV